MQTRKYKFLVVDFETYDPHLTQAGPGWAYGKVEILGAALKSDQFTTYYETDANEIKRIASESEVLIAHNAQYDLGLLYSLGVDLKDKKIYDTYILSKLYNNNLPRHNLDYLGENYLGINKYEKELAEAAITLGLVKSKVQDPVRIAKLNLKAIQNHNPQAVAKYAVQDVDMCYELMKFFKGNGVDLELAATIGKAIPALLESRARGVRIDLQQAVKVRDIFSAKIAEKETAIYSMAGREFNFRSHIDMSEVFDQLKIEYPRTEKGTPSFKKDWLEAHEHEICRAITDWRRYTKAKDDFIEKIIKLQEITIGVSYDDIIAGNVKYGRVYPEFNLLRAVTGRFSCTAPNLQQIPARDPEIGPLARSIYVPEDGETLYSLDFSAQEPRLQVHYANLVNARGAKKLTSAYKKDPRIDLHQIVADFTGLSRTEAKVVNLGIAYGQGNILLGKCLKKDVRAAAKVRKIYNTKMPYLDDLSKLCQAQIKNNGYIKTLLGRKLYNEEGFEYKAINKLIQGGAADQIIMTLIQAHEAGLKVLFSVHDEVLLSGTDEDAEKLQEIMTTCIPLTVPMCSDICSGETWAEAKDG